MSPHANLSSPSPRVAGTSQYLTFVLGPEVFAIGILAIKEIIEYGSVTPVPMMPPSVHGVINLRGAVVPVVDLSVRFGRPASPLGKRTCIVIVELEAGGERQYVGVLVDGVNAVLEIGAADVEPAPAFGAGICTDFIYGMARLGSSFVIIVDAARILASTGLRQALSASAALEGGLAA